MIFGDRSHFSIEVYHEPSGPEWAGFGRMAFDIEGVRFGDIHENHCSLFHAVDRIRDVYPKIESLWDKSFETMSDREIFDVIDHACYTGEPADYEVDYWQFNFLTGVGEQFDDAKTFIVCRLDGRVHILYQLRDDTIGSCSCSADVFRKVAEAFVCWFDEQVRTVGPPYFPVES